MGKLFKNAKKLVFKQSIYSGSQNCLGINLSIVIFTTE